MDVESESAGDFAGWVRQVNAAVADAKQAAAGAGSWFSRSSACINAEGRVSQTINRVQNLTFGAKRPGFIPGRGRQSGLAGTARAPSPLRYAAQSAISRVRGRASSGRALGDLGYHIVSLVLTLDGRSVPWLPAFEEFRTPGAA